jgi:hypothetical protein
LIEIEEISERDRNSCAISHQFIFSRASVFRMRRDALGVIFGLLDNFLSADSPQFSNNVAQVTLCSRISENSICADDNAN